MSTETSKRLVCRYIEEIVNTGDVTNLAAFITVEHGGAVNLLEPLLESGAIRVIGSDG